MLQNTSIQGLTVSGNTSLSNTVITGTTDINRTGSATTTIGNSGSMTVVAGNASLRNVSAQALTVGPLWAGATTLASASVTGTLGVTGATTLSGGATVTGTTTQLNSTTTTVGGTLGVTGLATLSGGATVTGTTTNLNSTSTMVGGTLGVTGRTTLGNASCASLGINKAVFTTSVFQTKPVLEITPQEGVTQGGVQLGTGYGLYNLPYSSTETDGGFVFRSTNSNDTPGPNLMRIQNMPNYSFDKEPTGVNIENTITYATTYHGGSLTQTGGYKTLTSPANDGATAYGALDTNATVFTDVIYKVCLKMSSVSVDSIVYLKVGNTVLGEIILGVGTSPTRIHTIYFKATETGNLWFDFRRFYSESLTIVYDFFSIERFYETTANSLSANSLSTSNMVVDKRLLVGYKIGEVKTHTGVDVDISGCVLIKGTADKTNWPTSGDLLLGNGNAFGSFVFRATPGTTHDTNTLRIFGSGGGINTPLVFRADGRLGIGTATPSYTLDVSGNTGLKGGLDIFQSRTALSDYPDLVPIRIVDAGDNNNRVGMWIYTNADSTSRRFCIASSVVGSGTLNFPTLIGTRPGTETRIGIAMVASDSAPVSALQVKGTITADASLSVTSDRRIKTDIVDVNDDQALTDLRKLKPKIYGYKDIYSKGTEKVYGFIAQEVKSVLNYSATLNTQYVPNIYEEATVMGDLLIFTTFNTNDLERDASGVILPKLKLRTLDNKDEEYVIIKELIDDKTIRIDLNSWINDKGNVVPGDKINVYGQEVSDFHTLNKDAIWTVATAALQEVDRQLQAEKQKTATLETTLASTQETLASCQETLAALVARIDALEQR